MGVLNKIFKKENIDKVEQTTIKADEVVSFVEKKIAPELKELEEITDSNIIKGINEFIPKASSFVKKASVATKNGTQIIEMIISSSKINDTLTKNGGEIIPITANELASGGLSKATLGASIGIAGVSVLVLVINIYQTRQVSKKMNSVSLQLEEVKEFQSIEYHNRIKSLIIDVLNILENKDVLFKKKDIRKRELDNLDAYEHECERLLGQANDMIVSLTKKNHKTFEKYQTSYNSIKEWLIYQQILSITLTQIAELKYALNLGAVSKEYCTSKLNKYLNESKESIDSLREWHEHNIKAFEIDFENKKYLKTTPIFSFLKKLPNIDDTKIIYAPLKDEDAITIKNQLEYKTNPIDNNEEAISIIIKDGKYYFKK